MLLLIDLCDCGGAVKVTCNYRKAERSSTWQRLLVLDDIQLTLASTHGHRSNVEIVRCPTTSISNIVVVVVLEYCSSS
jgi:hypothetical protein